MTKKVAATADSYFTYLFDLPEYTKAFWTFHSKAVNALIGTDPLLSLIPVVEVEEPQTIQYTLPSGETLEHASIRNKKDVDIEIDGLLKGDLDSYYLWIYLGTEALKPLITNQFFQRMEEVLDFHGNSVNANGQPHGPELYFQMFEKKEFSFDEQGNFAEAEVIISRSSKTGEYTIYHYSTPEELKNIINLPLEYEERFYDLIERKRQEFYARKRVRTIS